MGRSLHWSSGLVLWGRSLCKEVERPLSISTGIGVEFLSPKQIGHAEGRRPADIAAPDLAAGHVVAPRPRHRGRSRRPLLGDFRLGRRDLVRSGTRLLHLGVLGLGLLRASTPGNRRPLAGWRNIRFCRRRSASIPASIVARWTGAPSSGMSMRSRTLAASPPSRLTAIHSGFASPPPRFTTVKTWVPSETAGSRKEMGRSNTRLKPCLTKRCPSGGSVLPAAR